MKRILSGLSLLALTCGAVLGQSADSPAKFELADVHESVKGTGIQFFNGGVLSRGRYLAKNATMVDLISAAYGVDNEKVQGGPSWLGNDQFDVIAKVPERNYGGYRKAVTAGVARGAIQACGAQRYEIDAGVCADGWQRKTEIEGSGERD